MEDFTFFWIHSDCRDFGDGKLSFRDKGYLDNASKRAMMIISFMTCWLVSYRNWRTIQNTIYPRPSFPESIIANTVPLKQQGMIYIYASCESKWILLLPKQLSPVGFPSRDHIFDPKITSVVACSKLPSLQKKTRNTNVPRNVEPNFVTTDLTIFLVDCSLIICHGQ